MSNYQLPKGAKAWSITLPSGQVISLKAEAKTLDTEDKVEAEVSVEVEPKPKRKKS